MTPTARQLKQGDKTADVPLAFFCAIVLNSRIDEGGRIVCVTGQGVVSIPEPWKGLSPKPGDVLLSSRPIKEAADNGQPIKFATITGGTGAL